MERRYQIFLSSTYDDLQEERQRAIQAILELNHIPVGMEFFPASDDSAWEVIKRLIEESDYYLVIIAGRYGSPAPDGRSYTEKEFRYAIEKKVPTLIFLHGAPSEIPADKREADLELNGKLEEFREFCKRDRLVKLWKSPSELATSVTTSLIQLITKHPRTGWLRANEIEGEMATRILKLKDRVEELERERYDSGNTVPPETDQLAQGTDTVRIKYAFRGLKEAHGRTVGWEWADGLMAVIWNDILGWFGPLMIDESPDYELKNKLNSIAAEREGKKLDRTHPEFKEVTDFIVNEDDFHTIIIQLRSLGIITRSVKARQDKDTHLYWKLTPYGDAQMAKILAIKRNPPAES